ncbi:MULTISPECIES: GrpB family protein [unclassified Adlercreutzia]|uniref:GrpB family protein n=1 Tax=unclassified Adlercreutzia TaxID=2636013 RepID=UPI001F14E97E|nr:MULTISPECIES: GrpB family protein [unclassified Adlercreutzia]
MPQDVAMRISHIGTTAIEGVWAKPIIDMLLEADHAEFPRIKNALVTAGYLIMAEGAQRVSLNRGYTPHGLAERVFHLHMRTWGDDDEICFRNHLRAHPDVARAYEQLKLGLWKRYEFDRDRYTEAKTAFITARTPKAKEERAAWSSRQRAPLHETGSQGARNTRSDTAARRKARRKRTCHAENP